MPRAGTPRSDATNVLPRWEKRRHEKLDLHWKALGRSGVDHEGDPVAPGSLLTFFSAGRKRKAGDRYAGTLLNVSSLLSTTPRFSSVSGRMTFQAC